MIYNIPYLTPKTEFPPAHTADPSGIVALGADLSEKRLLDAYSKGIFPWFNEQEPIIWWSPDPRFILLPDKLKISRSMKQICKKNMFSITFDQNFAQVIAACAGPRKHGQETWITADMQAAYIRLHHSGYAHSVEAWYNGELIGGLYGVSLGKAFFGESMFTKMSNASKAAFIYLVSTLQQQNFNFIDCQVYTDHLKNFGATFISRNDFLVLLRDSLQFPTIKGAWSDML
jgi:leucyl/phenylalanyl-tRNA---protein transferase